MYRTIHLTLATLLWVPVGLAQEGAPLRGPAGGAPSSGANEQRRGGPGGPQGMVEWILRDVDANVGLTDAQKTQLRESLGKLGQEAMDQFRSNPPTPPDPEAFRTFREQLQQAAAAGDDAKVRELQRQFDGSGPGAMFRQMRDRGMDEVGKVLTPGQQEAYRQWRAVREINFPPPMVTDVGTIKDAVMKVSSLSDIQKTALDAAFQRYETQSATAATSLERNGLRNRLILDVQGVLRPGQQVLASDALGRQMMQRFQTAGGTQPSGRDRTPGGNRRTGSAAQAGARSGPAPGAQATATADPPTMDAWAAYVQTFVTTHDLEDSQQQAAYNILDDLEKRAGEFLTSHKMDLDDLDLLASQAATPDERAAIDRQRRIIGQPIADMFQELKDRLNSLLPPAEQVLASRSAASRSADSQPAAQRRLRSRRAAATQPAARVD
jgi:hypothetical protein